MTRITEKLSLLKDNKKTALIPFITAGDPDKASTVPLLHTLVNNGADIIEIGVPFSDPMADGPVIQRASERALVNEITIHDILEIVEEFRSVDNNTPIVLMGYLNPIEAMGYQEFAIKSKLAGVDGVLTVDLPPEEGSEFLLELNKNELDPIYLLAPTSSSDRIKKLTEAASGFVYYVSLKGVTGSASLNIEEASKKLELIRGITKLPVGVGFGIKDAHTAAAIGKISDAVVVGSAIVSLIEDSRNDLVKIHEDVGRLIKSMRDALDKNTC